MAEKKNEKRENPRDPEVLARKIDERVTEIDWAMQKSPVPNTRRDGPLRLETRPEFRDCTYEHVSNAILYRLLEEGDSDNPYTMPRSFVIGTGFLRGKSPDTLSAVADEVFRLLDLAGDRATIADTEIALAVERIRDLLRARQPAAHLARAKADSERTVADIVSDYMGANTESFVSQLRFCEEHYPDRVATTMAVLDFHAGLYRSVTHYDRVILCRVSERRVLQFVELEVKAVIERMNEEAEREVHREKSRQWDRFANAVRTSRQYRQWMRNTRREANRAERQRPQRPQKSTAYRAACRAAAIERENAKRWNRIIDLCAFAEQKSRQR